MEFNPAFHPWKPNLYPALARRSIALFLARAFWGQTEALSLTSTCTHRHYGLISSRAARARPRLGPPGYFTNNLFLIRHSAPLPVIKDPINGAGKGEAFK